MKLHELKASAGARKAVTRKGRGAGSGNGKTAGFGHKGQKARSGVKKAGFEGGQMPLQRRLPKRGFNNIFATKYVTIKVSDLEKFEAGATVDTEALLKAGIISKTLDGVKVLGNGELRLVNIDWNVKEYLKDFAFVPKYGEAVLDMIDAAPGTLAVDLGCGNGGLTGKLIERGYRVIGVDASVSMLALARERHPDTTFLQADACTFQLPEQVDVIFSNAGLTDCQHCVPAQARRAAGL